MKNEKEEFTDHLDQAIVERGEEVFINEVDFLLNTMQFDHIEEKIWHGFISRQSDTEIADWLGLSVKEIRSKRQNLYSKIGYQVAQDYRRVKNRQGFLSQKEANASTNGETSSNQSNLTEGQ